MKSRIPALMIASVLTSGAFAQIFPQTPTLPVTPIVSPPSAPTNLTQGDLEARRLGMTPFVVQWNQVIPTGTGPWLYPPATHFVLCFREVVGGSAPACSIASNDYRETIAAPSPRLTSTGTLFRYSTGSGIPESQLDRPYRFTVGACSAWVERSCRYVSSDVFYSSRNLKAHSAQTALASSNTTWKIDARASNTGDSDIPAIDVSMELFEVLYRGNPGRTCETDANDQARRFDTTLVVIDVEGGIRPMAMVSRDKTTGHYNGPTIAGIFRQGGFSVAQTLATVGTTIEGGGAERGIRVFDFPIPTGSVQRPFVILTTGDSGYAVREFNENDNSRAVCRVR